MIRRLAIAAAFTVSAAAGASAAIAQPEPDAPVWNAQIAAARATYNISADTTGSMFTSTNNPNRSVPAYDAQSGPRAVYEERGYYVEPVVHHRRYYDDEGRAYYYDDDGRVIYD